jgi:FixJ family two-component response regulator
LRVTPYRSPDEAQKQSMIDAGGNIPLISIVDDDASVRTAMANLVRSIGFAVRSFDSADQYLSSAERHQTACIVSDIQMAGTSGLDLQSSLAAQDDPTPIIFITAFPRPEIKKRALDAGAFCFLSKPFDDQMLIKCIKDAVKGREHSHS